jgi:hypothetical protein
MALFKITEAFAKNGIGAGMNAKDVASKHKLPVEVIEDQIEKGIKVELEHTSDLDKARQIAIDHIAEFADYYDRLKKMEEDAKAEEAKLAEEFSSFLKSELNDVGGLLLSNLTESEAVSDSVISEWADWKLTKFNIRSITNEAAEAFLSEMAGIEPRQLAVLSRREKISRIREAAERMPRNLKSEMTKMDGIKGEKRQKLVKAGVRSIAGKK